MMRRKKKSQRGMALLIALILVFMFSALAAGMMLTNQTDVNALANYRFVTQARFTAEAGAQTAANWLMFTLPTPTSATGFDITKYPVQAGGNDVVIYGNSSDGTSTYPDATQVTAFQTMTTNLNGGSITGVSLQSGSSVKLKATLMAMQPIPNGISGTSYTQVWEIASTGSVQSIKPVQVQVIERISRGTAPAYGNAVFATASGCNALNFGGNFSTDSWNSALGTYSQTKNTTSGGNVGSNGNLSIGGSADIGGNYYSPLTGIGTCSSGSPDAFTGSITAVNQIVTLSAPVSYPAPALPNPLPTATAETFNNDCPAAITSGCTKNSGNDFTLAPGTYGDITIDNNNTVHVSKGDYYLDNLVSNKGKIQVDDGGPVNFHVTCSTCNTLPFDFTGDIVASDGHSLGAVNVLYAGTAPVQKLNGNNAFYGILYAPNADVSAQVNGTFDWYGAIIAKTVTFASGNASVHYDLKMSKTYLIPGSWSVTSFTWSKY